MISALTEMQINEQGCIRIKEKGEEVRVDLGDIVYFEAQNHKINLICANATHNFYGRLGELEQMLADKGFVRCQKGYLVNASRIRRIRRSEVLLDNGRTLPMSANYLRQTKDTFLSAMR
jgi:two-component system, LytTR family, response regulator LytT